MNFPFFLIQARLGSSRLPGKMLMELKEGYTLLDSVVDQIAKAECASLDRIVVLTTESKLDDPLVNHLKERGIQFFRGSEEDVFSRYYTYLKSLKEAPDLFFRICADNPFIEPQFLDELFECAQKNKGSIYFSHRDANERPAMLTHYGFFGELISTQALLKLQEETSQDFDTLRQHVTAIFYRNYLNQCSFVDMPVELKDLPLRLTVDTENDLELVRKIWLATQNSANWKSVMQYVQANPNMLIKMEETIFKNQK